MSLNNYKDTPYMFQQTFKIFIPIAFFALALIIDKPFPEILPGFTALETGLVENLQAFLLLLSLIVALHILSKAHCYPKWIKAWLTLGILGSLYVLLEEISYGQHYFNWSTPEYWQAYTDQQETNFHNTSSWLDQKPRLILEIGVIFGGLIVPLLRRIRPSSIPEFSKPILPQNALFIIALIAIIPNIFERIMDLIGHPEWGEIFIRISEIQELYFYYFILLYFIDLKPQLDEHYKDKNHTP